MKSNQSFQTAGFRLYSRMLWAVTLMPLVVLLGLPVRGWAAPDANKAAVSPSPAPVVHVNRTLPLVEPPPLFPVFSEVPTDEEIERARVFEEPLLHSQKSEGRKQKSEEPENQALRQAIEHYIKEGNPEAVSGFTEFLEKYPETKWKASVLTNLGIVYRRHGYYSRALKAWEEAWKLSKEETAPANKALADLTVGELAGLNARLGRVERLEPLLAEVQGRDLSGPGREAILVSGESLAHMKANPEVCFLCGPLALNSIYMTATGRKTPHPKLAAIASPRRGFTLTEVSGFAKQLGQSFQMARREAGAELVLPAVINWKSEHYAAVLQKKPTPTGTVYLVRDPTFGHEIWLTQAAIEDEASGYFLIPAGPLPPGWQPVTAAEGRKVRGRGDPPGIQMGQTGTPASGGGGGPCPAGSCCKNPSGGSPGGGSGSGPGGGAGGPGGPGGGSGFGPYPFHYPPPPPPPFSDPLLHADNRTANDRMAVYRFQDLLAGLTIFDSPVGYGVPRGPSMNFTVTYNQREAFQPAVFTFSNLGARWNTDFLSYITDDPSQPGQTVTVNTRGGGQEVLTGFNVGTQSYASDVQTQTVLVRISSTQYERRFPDGGKEVYGQPDGAIAPRKVLLTQLVDAQGNTLTLTYDASLRLTAIRDALGQVTTLSYELPADSRKITKVTDPFGRFARFDYNASNQLSKITDVIGITSEFTYGSGDFITSLKTPYGTTTFSTGQLPGVGQPTRWIQATDPLGQTERSEFRNSTPGISPGAAVVPQGMFVRNIFNNSRNAFYWDKETLRQYGADYTKARNRHFLHDSTLGIAMGVIECERGPLERYIHYNYPGQSQDNFGAWIIGTSDKPTRVGRVLEDGTTQLYQFQRNALSKPTEIIDPAGRRFTLTYSADGIDLLRVANTTGGLNEQIFSATYNGTHQPLTLTDAAGQTSTLTYNPQGQLLTHRNPKNELTTYTYDANGYLKTVTGPVAGAVTTYSYDGFGRIRTVTDADFYTLAYDYDALDRVTKITYPDGTFEQITYDKLEAGQVRDRQGRITTYSYDAVRRLTAVTDPLQRTTQFRFCGCGGVSSITDPQGKTTQFARDIQGRVTEKIYHDNSRTRFLYDLTGRVKQVIDAKEQLTNYLYFQDDNLKSVSYVKAQLPTPDVSFTYDPNYNRLATMTDQYGVTTYGYKPVGTAGALQPASVDGPLANDTITYGYDELSRELSRAVNGVARSVTYDTLGRVTSEINPLGTFGFNYVGVTERLDNVTYPNGQNTQFSYFDNLGDRRLKTLRNGAAGRGILSQFDYTYLVTGEMDTQTRSVPGLKQSQTTYTYGYDNASQLTGAVLKNGPTTLLNFTYGYDPASNRSSEQINAQLTTYTTNNLNQITTRQQGASTRIFSYDKNGNLTSDGARAFEWDAEDRLTAVVLGTHRSEFGYDGFGRRVRITERENGVVQSDNRYLWCDGDTQPGEERDVSGGSVNRRFFTLGMQQGANVFYYTKDHLGSVREMTDGTGAVVARYDYDPYGRQLKVGGTQDAPFGYTGFFNHGPSGLSLTLFRAYDPNLGRWLRREPLGEQAGANLYAYVANLPSILVDLDGLQPSSTAQKPNPAQVTTQQQIQSYYAAFKFIQGLLGQTTPSKAPENKPDSPPPGSSSGSCPAPPNNNKKPPQQPQGAGKSFVSSFERRNQQHPERRFSSSFYLDQSLPTGYYSSPPSSNGSTNHQ